MNRNYCNQVASGDISFANATNCAQFLSYSFVHHKLTFGSLLPVSHEDFLSQNLSGPQSFGHSRLPAGHATEKCTSRLISFHTLTRRTGLRLTQVFLIVFFFLMTIPSFGSYKSLYSYYNFTFGAKSLSMSNAFTAISDDLSAVYLNPAGIAALKTPKIYLSYEMSNLKNTYDIETRDYGSYTENYTNNLNIDYKNIDFFSVSVPANFLNTKWTFALSYYRLLPYNFDGKVETLLSKNSDESTTKTTKTVLGENGIDVISLSAAFAVSEYFYFGATAQQFINSAMIDYSYSSEFLDYSKTFKESIRGRSYIFGILFIASEDVSIGFSYHTKFTETLNTNYTYTEDIEANNTESIKESILAFPARFSIGIAARLLPEWTISYDFAKILWSKSTITNYHNATASLPYPIRDDFTFTQTDITNSNIGTELTIPFKTSLLSIRGGMSSKKQLFSGSDDEQVKLKGYSCGIGFALERKLVFDIAFLYEKGLWLEKAYFQPSSSATTTTDTTVNSNYKKKVLKFSVTYNF